MGASAISIGVLDAPALYDHYREVGNFTKDIGTTRITTAAIGETVSMVGAIVSMTNMSVTMRMSTTTKR